MQTRSAEPKILVQGVGINLGEALLGQVRQTTEQMKERYLGKLTEASITFKRDGSFFTCTMTYKAGGLRENVVHHESTDIRNAFNGARRKLEAQLKRIKVLKRDHHHPHARPDKALQNDGEHRVNLRHVPPADATPDLTTMQGADDYAKAVLQKAKQEQALLAEQMREPAPAFPIAAE